MFHMYFPPYAGGRKAALSFLTKRLANDILTVEKGAADKRLAYEKKIKRNDRLPLARGGHFRLQI